MLTRLKVMTYAVRQCFSRAVESLRGASHVVAGRARAGLKGCRTPIFVLACTAGAGYLIYTHPPIQRVAQGEVGLRVNQLTGALSEFRNANALVVPGIHDMRVYSLRDQTYRPVQASRASGAAPVQSKEGLSLGIDLVVRYALDPAMLSETATKMDDHAGASLVEPAVNGVMYQTFARYTVREIFSTKRGEIQQVIETELKPRLAADGIGLRSVQMGNVDLPADYKRGMEGLLAEELATEKMRYTLELKGKRVRETQLEGEADKVRREKAAEAAAREQLIAAKAQEEAMKHVLPLKQRQIEQRKLEAEAEQVARVRGAEGNAQARKIEANGEAEARQRLAEAEAYRLERVGKVNAEQMGREGALLSQHPLLIHKALTDKLSDKIQVMIAPPTADAGFIGAGLIGTTKRETRAAEDRYAAGDHNGSREGK